MYKGGHLSAVRLANLHMQPWESRRIIHTCATVEYGVSGRGELLHARASRLGRAQSGQIWHVRHESCPSSCWRRSSFFD